MSATIKSACLCVQQSVNVLVAGHRPLPPPAINGLAEINFSRPVLMTPFIETVSRGDLQFPRVDATLSLTTIPFLPFLIISNREGIGSLYEDGKDSYPLHEVTVAAPNVSMLITDQFGGDISAARVGDPLSLRIVITDGNSPYQLFLRQLVAFDTIDESEIVLVDDHGCPTDPAIMGAVERGFGKDRSLSTSFDAFKFPNSENVRFRALVSPCVGSCEPVHCYAQGSDGTHQQTYSYGRRRRSANNLTRSMDDLMVTRNLQVLDTFPFDSEDNPNSVERTSRLLPFCGKSLSYVLSGVMLLLGQIVIFAVWTSAIIRNRRRQSAMQSSFDNSCFDNRSDSSLNFCTSPSLLPSLPISIYNHHRC